jgi:tetratricopeptide (TPR) repeat protein
MAESQSPRCQKRREEVFDSIIEAMGTINSIFILRNLLWTPVSIAMLICFSGATCGGDVHALIVRQQTSRRGEGNQNRQSSRAARLVADGVAALERGDADSARGLFQQALQANPNNVDAHTYLGVLADQTGDFTAAERHFAQAARFAPRSPSARNNYGAILLRRGRTPEAAAEFEASLQLDAQQPSALVNLAQIRFADGSPDALRAARELFTRAYAIAPDVQISRALTVIALRLGDRAGAANYFRDYSARLTTEGARNAEVMATAARAELGVALVEAGLNDEALPELTAAVQADPTNVSAIVSLARAHLARQEIPAAGRTLESAVARGLDSALIYAALADVYHAAGRPENAIPAMRLAIEREPQSESYRFRYGMLLTETQAPAAAIIRLQEALREFPRSSRLLLALGVAQLFLGANDDATRSFERAIELDPRFAPALAYLGTTYAERGQYAEAIPFYERALAIDDELAIVHYLLADAMLKAVSPDTARVERHLTRAIALDTSYAPSRLALAKLHLRNNRLNEAVTELERVVQINPNLAEAHYQLGRTLMRLRRTTEAQTALATFRRLSETQREQSQNERRDIVRRLANVRF